MSTNSRGNARRGKKLATAACDLCRLRKVQCIFVAEADCRCKRCVDAGVDCTFLKGHRPRGRVSRHVAAARAQRQSSMFGSVGPTGPGTLLTRPAIPVSEADGTETASTPAPTTPVTNPSNASDNLVTNLGVTHLCPLSCAETILNDFHDYLYPVLPFVHLPTLMSAVQKDLWTDEPANRPLFRTVMAVAAATIASIPRRFSAYSNGQYDSVQAMADRALRLVILSRVVSPSHLDDDRSLESCVTSLVLSVAAFYTGRGGIARNLTNEAVVLFRSLGLYRKQEHENLCDFDSEICKRLFWIFYINQIHDRLDSVIPHYPFCFEPMETDWEFLIPRENEDESLFYANSPPDPHAVNNEQGANVMGSPLTTVTQPPTPGRSARSRPIVSGFYALLRVYLCVLDTFSADFPRPPPSVLTSLPLLMEPRFLVSVPESEFYFPASPAPNTAHMTLTSVTQLMRRVRTTMEQIPPELHIDVQNPPPQAMSRSAMQKFIIAANVKMTSLFVQSTALETYAAQVDRQSSQQAQPFNAASVVDSPATSFSSPATSLPSTASPTTLDSIGGDNELDGSSVHAQIWKIREKLASEALEIVHQFPQEALEANGASLILKARKIAATLLERDETFPLPTAAAARMDSYLEQFIHALASIDYVHPNTYLVTADAR
ncbi:hypothetical protein Sste5346_006463 [Sporothrix stenoceras]|uniref:Zn(2)-C6 fungal-type domain-containing protein n=1 Tax=Sporothrix stenoceras TaxID=5173 RepID=A0ABR3YZD4_9PEZI